MLVPCSGRKVDQSMRAASGGGSTARSSPAACSGLEKTLRNSRSCGVRGARDPALRLRRLFRFFATTPARCTRSAGDRGV
ncbi:MAG: hypothetical protein M5U28_03265 [Sandaracinaceae bacterium]|nr:hypothetical protein [Sandaracinaceae bacterium]